MARTRGRTPGPVLIDTARLLPVTGCRSVVGLRRQRRRGLGDRPYRLLRVVRGLTLVDLPEREECCGFGGTFAIKNSDVSVAMGADEVRHVRETGAEVLVAADNSCLTHIGGMLGRERSGGAPCTSPRCWPPPNATRSRRTPRSRRSRRSGGVCPRRRCNREQHLRRHARIPGGGQGRGGRHPARSDSETLPGIGGPWRGS